MEDNPMNFKEYMEFRADQECPIGVIAFDLLNEPKIPMDAHDKEILKIADALFLDTTVSDNWSTFKTEYLDQLLAKKVKAQKAPEGYKKK